MENRGSIRTKLIKLVLAVSLSTLAVLTAVFAVNVVGLRSSTQQANHDLSSKVTQDSTVALGAMAQENLMNITKSTAETVNGKLGVLQSYSQMLANTAGNIFNNPENYQPMPISPPSAANDGKLALQYIYLNGLPETTRQAIERDAALAANAGNQLLEMVRVDPSVTGCYISFETSLHVVADESSKSRVGNTKDYTPTKRAWYIGAKESGKTTFSDVFDDSQGRGLSISCATPFYDKRDKLLGVVGVGATLSDINDLVLSTRIGETGRMFVLNEQGQVIISRNIQRDSSGSIIREDLLTHPTMSGIAARMLAGESGVEQVDLDGVSSFVAYYPLSNTGWSIAAVTSTSEALALSDQTKASIQVATDEAIASIDRSLVAVAFTLLVAVVGMSVLVSVLGARFSSRLTKPLLALSESVGIVASGQLDYTIDIHTNDEIESLANSVNDMTHQLQHYIGDLTRVTAEKERIGTELNVATRIQASMLPSIFPAFPERSEIDIYATMHPAKEVGGDFYDFFLVDDDHLAVVMADVSGKGVPAALFMVIAKTIIKNHAQNRLKPADVFTNANRQLCENNEAGLFVTAWMGVLNLRTGHFCYVNAGHNPPALMHAGQQYKFLPSKPGFVLAGLEDITYEQCDMQLLPGDILYLYTDGVTEATNLQEELYGDDRLLAILSRNRSLSVTELLPAVRDDTDLFVGEAPQFDDITMLGLKFNGR